MTSVFFRHRRLLNEQRRLDLGRLTTRSEISRPTIILSFQSTIGHCGLRFRAVELKSRLHCIVRESRSAAPLSVRSTKTILLGARYTTPFGPIEQMKPVACRKTGRPTLGGVGLGIRRSPIGKGAIEEVGPRVIMPPNPQFGKSRPPTAQRPCLSGTRATLLCLRQLSCRPIPQPAARRLSCDGARSERRWA